MVYFWCRSQGCMVATANPFSYLYGHTTHPVHAGRRGWCILALGVTHYTFSVTFFIIYVKNRGARKAIKREWYPGYVAAVGVRGIEECAIFHCILV
jgi:hypothetical protein